MILNIHHDKKLYKLIVIVMSIFLVSLFALFTAAKGLAAGIFAVLLVLWAVLFSFIQAFLYKWLVLDIYSKKPLAQAVTSSVGFYAWILSSFIVFGVSLAILLKGQVLLEKTFPPAPKPLSSPVSVIPPQEGTPGVKN
jgi:hypothetical protein